MSRLSPLVKTYFLAAGVLLTLCVWSGIGAAQTSVSELVEPGATYLYTGRPSCSPADSPADPAIVDLEAAGFAPGDILKLSYSVEPPGLYLICRNPDFLRPAEQIGVFGVFSSSNRLLEHNAVDLIDNLRVPDAIDVGFDDFTGPTFFCNESNDIPQDFRIFPPSGFTMQIPDDATHLFLGINDSYYADNCGNLTVTLTQDINVKYIGQTDCNSSDSGFDATNDPPWLSVAVGQTTQVAQAVITPAASAGDVDFQSDDSRIATVRPATAGSSPQTLQVTGITTGTTTIDALDAHADGNLLGSLNVVVYEKKTLTVAVFVITPKKRPKHTKECEKPNPGTTQASLQTGLNNIWDQAAVQFTVKKFVKKKVDFDVDEPPDCRLDTSISSTALGPELKALTDELKDPAANINIYYVPSTLDRFASNVVLEETGEKPLNLIFVPNEHPGSTEYITAHEIGHVLLGPKYDVVDMTRLMHIQALSSNPCLLTQPEWDKSNDKAGTLN